MRQTVTVALVLGLAACTAAPPSLDQSGDDTGPAERADAGMGGRTTHAFDAAAGMTIEPHNALGADGASDTATTPITTPDASEDVAAAPDSGGHAPGFRHPGARITAEQLAFLKGKIAAGAEPWTTAFNTAKNDPLASLSYTPKPFADVICNTASASPNGSCLVEKSDARAAYTDALIWALTGDTAYAQKAIAIMNAWSAVLKMHTGSNTPLQCGWVGTVFARAGELVRHTGAGWAQKDVDQFATMLRTAYLPNVINGALRENGNWEMSTADALVQIAVFLDDQNAFDKALALWRRRVPAYIYMKADGAKPVMIAGQGASWYGPQAWVDGFTQETCRDLAHTQWALSAMINVAETALIQGVDLYAEQTTRVLAALELHAGFLVGGPRPAGLCGLMTVTPRPTWEIAYNHYANRRALSLPNTKALIGRPGFRPTGFEEHLAWETLTHAELGSVGIE